MLVVFAEHSIDIVVDDPVVLADYTVTVDGSSSSSGSCCCC